MGASGGPKIISDDLVLCLDAHDAKSYAGEPTTNLSANSDYSGATLDSINSSSNGGWGSTFDRWVSLIEGPAGKKVRAFHLNLTGTTGSAHAEGAPYELSGIDSQYGTLTSGNSYRASAWAKVIRADGSSTAQTSSNLLYLTGTAGLGSSNMTVGTEWTRISASFSISSTGTYRLRHYFYNVSVGDTLVIAEPQIELKGYATPYVYSSRSATNGWVDRTGNSNGTLTNMAGTEASHRRVGQVIEPISNAYLNFDGSNDYVNVTATKAASCTFSCWAKTTSLSTNPMLFNAGTNGGGPDLFFYNGSISWNTWDGSSNPFATIPASVTDGNWHYYVVVNDASSNADLYYDGEFLGDATYKDASGNTNLTIGGNTASYQWDGGISVFKLNNKVLTAAEVKQNFNAQRGRFGV